MTAGRMPLRGTGLWPSVEPALQSPSRLARLTIPCAGCRGQGCADTGPAARQLRPLAPARGRMRGAGAGSPLRGTARCAGRGPSCGGQGRSPRGVFCPSKRYGQHRSPEFSPRLPMLAQAATRPRRVAAHGCSAVFIKLRFTNLPPPIRAPCAAVSARRRTQGNGAAEGQLHGQQTTVERLRI